MDTSETYIKMCEKATEIQSQKGYKCGDWCVSTKLPKAYKYRISCEGEDVEDDNSGDHVYSREKQINSRLEDGYVWLPRQDQLQEMIPLPSNFHRVCDKLYAFTDWVKVNATYEASNCTMEQLWLAFIMKEKYKKIWNGEDWIEQK